MAKADTPRSAVGTGPFTGLLFLFLALFVGFFVWRDRAIETSSEADAAFYTVGMLAVFGLVPFFFVIVGSAWRTAQYAALHRIRGDANKRLENALAGSGGLFSSGADAKEVEKCTRELIGIYGEASSVSSRIGFYLFICLGAVILLIAAALQGLIGSVLTQNQANLLTVYVVLTTFSAYLLAWPAGASAARAFDPSGQIAKLIVHY